MNLDERFSNKILSEEEGQESTASRWARKGAKGLGVVGTAAGAYKGLKRGMLTKDPRKAALHAIGGAAIGGLSGAIQGHMTGAGLGVLKDRNKAKKAQKTNEQLIESLNYHINELDIKAGLGKAKDKIVGGAKAVGGALKNTWNGVKKVGGAIKAHPVRTAAIAAPIAAGAGYLAYKRGKNNG